MDAPINAACGNDGALRSATETTLASSQVDADAYTAIFQAGGYAMIWDFPDNTALAGIAARNYERGGVIAAVCH
ncbi:MULTISPECIES: hypothetical protein [unclassified Pseudomonas]|uniref:hypothetical protein n=1 Tax=unclassified Pseudomonas TaxID=196821 RepID=UPI002E8124C7|nr:MULTISPECIES: hypothetical protein [unclassified Pseudomonas]